MASGSRREIVKAAGPTLKVRQPEVVPLLDVAVPADVPKPDLSISHDLKEAALQGLTAKVKTLLMDGASCHRGDPEDETVSPLMHASLGGSVDVCRVLLDAHAEVNLRSW